MVVEEVSLFVNSGDLISILYYWSIKSGYLFCSERILKYRFGMQYALIVSAALLTVVVAQNRLYPCTCCDSLVGRIRRTGCRFFCDRDKDGNGLLTQLELFALVDQLSIAGENYIRRNRFLTYAQSTLNLSATEAGLFYDRLAKKNTLQGNPTVVEKVDMRIFNDNAEAAIGTRTITEAYWTTVWSNYYTTFKGAICDAYDRPTYVPTDPVLRERYLLDATYRRQYLADPGLETLDPYYYSEDKDPFYTYRAKGYIRDVNGRGVLDSKYRLPGIDGRGRGVVDRRGRGGGYRGDDNRRGGRYVSRRTRESYSTDYYNRGDRSRVVNRSDGKSAPAANKSS